MSDVSAKPVIFISFSHLDEPEKPVAGEVAWLTFVQSFLAPVVKAGIFELWTDERLHGGDEIDPAIARKLAECDIFVLLVSRHSLASAYVVDKEITTIKKRQEGGQDVRLFPIVLSPFPKAALGQVEGRLLRPRDGDPLSLMSKDEREVAMAEIADEIAEVAQKAAARKADHAKAERLEQVAKGAMFDVFLPDAKGPTASMVDISHLPETPYERLVGRDAELQRLDQAWVDLNTNIISLIAEGGAGKSALVNEWLNRMRTDRYRGADTVLGWSFYSQGTKERATSADQFLNWAIEKLAIKIETTSATAKGEAIAEEIGKRRILLVLDGCEPLQHGLDRQQGELKDQGLRALLRRLASMPPSDPHGLVVLTSRLAIQDVGRWKASGAPVVDVSALSDEAGAALLRDNGVWGTDKELLRASYDFGGHALALGLLASYLKEKHFGDVRRRDRIRAWLENDDNARHDHARRVMESYESEWLVKKPTEHSIMYLIGLFDRPAAADCLAALRQDPAVEVLARKLSQLDEGSWQVAIARLREARLLLPINPLLPDALDAHPLVREWFGERLKKTNEAAWKRMHGRLFDYLCSVTNEGDAPTLEDITPLYQALAHGCRAGRYEEALKVFGERICRLGSFSKYHVFYSMRILGAVGSDLAAISWFFEDPYSTPASALPDSDKGWILNIAAIRLRAQGRLTEALPALQAALRIALKESDSGTGAIVRSTNLSEAQLLAGQISDAVKTAERSLEYAKKSNNRSQIMVRRTVLASALHAAGRREQAEGLFEISDQEQSQVDDLYTILFSLRGYLYCVLLLEKGQFDRAMSRATKTLAWSQMNGWLLEVALDNLTLGRAHFGLALSQRFDARRGAGVRAARLSLNASVDGFRKSSSNNHIPEALLSRAALSRCLGDWIGSYRDIEDVEEIAEPGPMKLFLCDLALERARVALAEAEAFAPLNGLIQDGPPAPVVPDAAEIARLKEEATRQLAVAADYIRTCGYHRRDEALAELQAVLRGDRKFADLPPRV